MIAKHVPMNSVRKSNISNLIKYLTDPQNKEERVDSVSVTNCHQQDPLDAALEMQATQALNTRAETDKTYHLIVSFRQGENPEPGVLKDIENRIAAGLGFSEHQRVSVVHRDTDNLHIHLAINKIHPETHNIHTPYYDHYSLSNLCEKLEQEFNLEQDNHKRIKHISNNRADDMEHHSGIESLLSWIKRECIEEIKQVRTWDEMHEVLGKNGLIIKEQGNGLVFQSEGGITVKASSVARELSKNNLEKKLGQFKKGSKSGSKNVKHKYKKEPLKTRVDTTELYAKYKLEQERIYRARAKEWEKLKTRKRNAINSIKQSGKVKRSMIKLLKGRSNKKILYSLNSKKIKAEIQKINNRYLKQRQVVYDKYQKKSWADWLKSEAVSGNKEALKALRARKAKERFKGNRLSGKKEKNQKKQWRQDNITKKGTVIYRVRGASIRDDGSCLQVSKERTAAGLKSALEMAVSKYGQDITVNGSDEFKMQVVVAAAQSKVDVVFSDNDLERQRKLLITKLEERNDGERERRKRVVKRSPGNNGHKRRRPDVRREGRNRVGRDGTIVRSNKPGIGKVGGKPPTQTEYRLQNMSELSMVRLNERSEMLLSGNAFNRMEPQRTERISGVRRGVSGGRLSDADQAANKYIAERESKRSRGVDISKHKRYNKTVSGEAIYSGIRTVDKQKLALLEIDKEIYVLPIDNSTSNRLKRLKVGSIVYLSTKGTIKTTKGRSR